MGLVLSYLRLLSRSTGILCSYEQHEAWANKTKYLEWICKATNIIYLTQSIIMAHMLPFENKAKVLLNAVVVLFAYSVRDYVLHHPQEKNLSREMHFLHFQQIFCPLKYVHNCSKKEMETNTTKIIKTKFCWELHTVNTEEVQLRAWCDSRAVLSTGISSVP